MAARRHSRRPALVYVYALIAAACLMAVTLLLPGRGAAPSAEAHSIVVDGLTNDWCVNLLLGMAPDSVATFSPPQCAFGTETFWKDTQIPPVPGDTIGYLAGGGWTVPPYPLPPLPDPEVDLQALGVTEDWDYLNLLVLTGPFPSSGYSHPIVEIAVDYLPSSWNPLSVWYNPIVPIMAAPNVGLTGNFSWEFLITTDVLFAPPSA